MINEPTTEDPRGIDIARTVMSISSDLQASNIVVLDVRTISYFTNYFVLMTADSRRQIQALANNIEGSLAKTGVNPHHSEGTADSGWILIDYGDVMVHVFDHDNREFYNIENLWDSSVVLFRIQ